MHTNTQPRSAWQSQNTDIANAIVSPITGNPVAERLYTDLSQALRTRIPDLLNQVWQGHLAGQITYEQAEHLVETFQQPALSTYVEKAPQKRRRFLDVSRRSHKHRSPEQRARSRARRRRLARNWRGYLSYAISKDLTDGELATLSIIAASHRIKRRCDLFIDAIAAKAGVERTTVQRALRRAQALGLINVQERRLGGARNDSNIITIISTEWLDYLAKKPSGGVDSKENAPRFHTVRIDPPRPFRPFQRPHYPQTRYPNTRRPP